jgi:hypothetical protein
MTLLTLLTLVNNLVGIGAAESGVKSRANYPDVLFIIETNALKQDRFFAGVIDF